MSISPKKPTTGKTIVILCDGTSNEFTGDQTNVLRLAHALEQSPRQVVWYDPGVGTMPYPALITKTAQWLSEAAGLAFGVGMVTNILQAYTYLSEVYEPGDELVFFGFSRGAYTVRVLAGLVAVCGILKPDNEQLADYAFDIYRKIKNWDGRDRLTGLATHPVDAIRFVGLFDTVSSIFLAQQKYPYTFNNPRTTTVRHALSIDERRAYYRTNRVETEKTDNDVREVWFAGVHADVGGGYAPAESGPARLAFDWMVKQAEGHVTFDADALERIRAEMPQGATAPALHDSMTRMWSILEYLPKSILAFDDVTKTWHRRWVLNLKRTRPIREGDEVHVSVRDRIAAGGYAPPNLPRDVTYVD